MAVRAEIDRSDLGTESLRVRVSEQGTTTLVGLEGEWDLAEQEVTRAAFRRALARRPECLVLDLSRLSFIDSSGVHAMVGLASRTARLNIHLVIVPGSKAVQRIFEICRLTERLPFAPRY